MKNSTSTSRTTRPKAAGGTPARRASKPRRSKAAPGATPAPAEAAIAVRAHEIFVWRNGGPGDSLSDWLQAEFELRAVDQD
jgi:hypothetical protein